MGQQLLNTRKDIKGDLAAVENSLNVE